jgi:hypothetical protein
LREREREKKIFLVETQQIFKNIEKIMQTPSLRQLKRREM